MRRNVSISALAKYFNIDLTENKKKRGVPFVKLIDAIFVAVEFILDLPSKTSL